MFLATATNNQIDFQAIKIQKLKAQLAALKAENEELKELAFVDGLTGCYNRRSFDKDLQDETNRAARDGNSVAVIVIDIDFFKKYNDTHGHQGGDDLLSGLGQIWKSTIERSGDKLYRYGGEEFVVLLPNTTKDEVSRVVGLIQRGAADMGITVSMGVADTSEGINVVGIADKRLYNAKNNGRNQACFA